MRFKKWKLKNDGYDFSSDHPENYKHINPFLLTTTAIDKFDSDESLAIALLIMCIPFTIIGDILLLPISTLRTIKLKSKESE